MTESPKAGLNERPLLVVRVKSFARAEEYVLVNLVLTKSFLRLYVQGDMQREVALDALDAITYSTTSSQFVVHVKSDVDERFGSSEHRKDVVEMLFYLVTVHADRRVQRLKFFPLTDRSLAAFATTEEDLEEGHILRPEFQFMRLFDHKKFLQFVTEEPATRKPRSRRTTRALSLEDFELMKMLGKGAHGKVLLCTPKSQPELRYAMKVLKKKHIMDAKQLEHTIAEKAILSRMNHPFLVSMKHTFQTDSKIYFVMEFMAGGELFQHLKRVGCFTEGQTKFICACLVLALGHLHNADYIYRDLKPENILFDEQGFAKLSDFGLAKVVPVGEVAHTFCGTPEYLAPEVILNKGCNRPADWWSLGILAYEMLFGAPPFYSEDVQEMYKRTILKPLRFPGQANVSKLAMDFVSGLLVKNQKNRLGSIADSLEVMNHPWFADVCWSSLLAKQVMPPYRPMKSRWELNFDPQFIREEARDSATTHKSDIPVEVSRRFQELTEEGPPQTLSPSQPRRTYSAANLGKLVRARISDTKQVPGQPESPSCNSDTKSARNQSFSHLECTPKSKGETQLACSKRGATRASIGSEEESVSTGVTRAEHPEDTPNTNAKTKAFQSTLASSGMFPIGEKKTCEESFCPLKQFESASDAAGDTRGSGEGSGPVSPRPELAH